MPRALRCLACTLLLFFAGRLWAQNNFNTVVVFGDSLSDTGNIAHLTKAATAGLIGYPGDYPALGLDYTAGRFTDGKDTQPAAQAYQGVWIEQLAASFPAKPAVTDSLDGGTNYAYGDATTANSTTTVSEDGVSITLHNMGQQLQDYLGQSPAPVPNANTLYVLWGGSNDIYQAVAAAVAAGTDPTAAATAAATTAVSNEAGYLQQLISLGATNFLVVNVPPLGLAPNYMSSLQAGALNTGAHAFFQALPTALATLKSNDAAAGITVNFYQTDVFSQFVNVSQNAFLVGLSNTTNSAQNITTSPDTYLIWDGIHPTTTGHHLVAELAANLFVPLVDSVSTLTAPATALGGQSITLSATVTPRVSSSTVPTGLVSFFNGTSLIGSGPLNSAGSVSTTFTPTGNLEASISAVYSGDTTYGYSSSPLSTVLVLTNAIGTSTTLSSSNTTIVSGTPVTLTAALSPAVSTFGNPVGAITFLSGSTMLGTAQVSNGRATLATMTLPSGSLNITANYAANGAFAASTSAPVSVTVLASPVSTSTALASSSTSVVAGTPVTLTATVGPAVPTYGVPTGTVTFLNGFTTLGTGTVSNGVATFTTASLPTGTLHITASYAASGLFGSSTSGAITETVLANLVTTSTALASNSSSAATGTSVTFTATVTPSVTTYGTPVGTVTFLEGSTTLGTGTLNNGVATFTTATLPAGSQSIVASYPGSGLFAGSSSPSVTVALGAPSFTPSTSTNSLIIADGTSGSTTVTAQPNFGYSGTVTLACGTVPAHFSCAFSTASLSLSGSAAASATLTLATNAAAATVSARPGSMESPSTWIAALFVPATAGLFWKRRRGLPALLAVLFLLAVSAAGLAGCGSSSSSPSAIYAARGAYTVPVTFTGTGGAAAQTVNLTVTVQ